MTLRQLFAGLARLFTSHQPPQTMLNMLVTSSVAVSSTVAITQGKPYALRFTMSNLTAGTLILRDVTTNRPCFQRDGTAISFDLSAVSSGFAEFIGFGDVQLSLTSGTGTGNITFEIIPIAR